MVSGELWSKPEPCALACYSSASEGCHGHVPRQHSVHLLRTQQGHSASRAWFSVEVQVSLQEAPWEWQGGL